jgi:hypothetical protein
MTSCRSDRAPPAPQLFDEKHGRGPLTLHRIGLDQLLYKLEAFAPDQPPPWTRGAPHDAVWRLLAARPGRPVGQLALRRVIMPHTTEGRRLSMPATRETLSVVVCQLRRQRGAAIVAVRGEGYMLALRP